MCAFACKVRLYILVFVTILCCFCGKERYDYNLHLITFASRAGIIDSVKEIPGSANVRKHISKLLL